MALCKAFYRQKCLYLDSEGCHSRRPGSFEPTFSLVSGRLDALDLRLCSETARGRDRLTFFFVFVLVSGPGAGTMRRRETYCSMVIEHVTIPVLVHL